MIEEGHGRRLQSAWRLGVQLLVALALVTSGGNAASADDPSEYRELIEAAVSEFDAHRFAEARALFRRAHDSSPNARTLRGIGLASFELADYVEAYRALSGALTDPRRPLTPEQRDSSRALLERTRVFLAILTLDVQPPSAEVLVDGTPAVLESDGRLLLPLGTFEVTARAPGHLDATRSVQVEGGEEHTLRLSLAAVEGPVSALSRPEARTQGPPPNAGEEGGATGLVLVVGGAVASAGSLAAGLGWVLHTQPEVDRCQEVIDAGGMCTNEDAVFLARDLSAVATVGLAVLGVAGLAIGAVVLASDDGDSHPLSVRCGLAGTGWMCGGRF